MKFHYFIIAFFFSINFNYSQEKTILLWDDVKPNSGIEALNGKTIIIETADKNLNKINIRIDNITGVSKYKITSDNFTNQETVVELDIDNFLKEIEFTSIDEAIIKIEKDGVLFKNFTLKVKEKKQEVQVVADNDEDTDKSNFLSAEEIYEKDLPGLKFEKGLGFIVLGKGKRNNTKYRGSNYVHVFFDANGELVFGALPQGSPEINYVVHVATSIDKLNNNISYSVNQKTGELSDELFFRNSGELAGIDFNGTTKQSDIEYVHYHKEFLLRESNIDITFDIKKLEIIGNELNRVTLSANTIPIKILHGSFDFGIIKTDLENPDFSLVKENDDANAGKVNRTNTGSHSKISAMVTFYGSPVIAFKKYILRKDIPSYKLTGRNYISDHSLFERIYPTVGLGIDDDIFNNIFYGFNWEIVRGGSLFIGWHYGKVNAFDVPDDTFQFENTEISSQNFELFNKTQWKTDFAIGVNLDILVITNLLRRGATGGTP